MSMQKRERLGFSVRYVSPFLQVSVVKWS